MMSTGLAVLLFITLISLVGMALSWLSRPSGDNNNQDTTSTDDAGTSSNGESTRNIDQLIETVNEKLPQTQCAQCGYPGCRPYATAIINEDVAINQCPPGGDVLIRELATLLGKEALPLNSAFGENKPAQIAIIDEAVCIGCTLCIAACPVDAIVGASRLMHTVISDQCTGCELCLPPCPVDCIDLIEQPVTLSRWQWPKPT